MATHDNLSPDQFAMHMAGIKREVMARHQAKRDAGEWLAHPDPQGDLFHGTNASLPEGSLITTPAASGREQQWAGKTLDTKGQHTFATNDLTEAYSFGRHAAAREQEESGSYYGAIPAAHIYEVSPVGRMTCDREECGDDPEEVRSFQSRQPLRVGREVSRGARDEYLSNMGQDWEEHD